MRCLSVHCLRNVDGKCTIPEEVTVNYQGACDSRYTNWDAEHDEYAAVCKCGYTDCVLNPRYLERHHHEWWVKLGSPTECTDCEDGERYDDEDK